MDVAAPDRERIELNRDSVSIYTGTADTLVATVYDQRGHAISAPVIWTTADDAVAWVDTLGVVTATWPGQTVLTATAGVLTTSIPVVVNADSTPPTVREFTVSPDLVRPGGGEVTVTITVAAQDGESGIPGFSVGAVRPSERSPQRPVSCGARSPVSGTLYDGTWRCRWILDRYSEPGVWQVRATVGDRSNNVSAISVELTVEGTDPDDTAPTLSDLTYAEERATRGQYEYRFLGIRASDSEAGMEAADIWLTDASGTGSAACGVDAYGQRPSIEEWRAAAEMLGGCEVPLIESGEPLIWTIIRVRLVDLRGNERIYDEVELREAGFLTRIDLAR